MASNSDYRICGTGLEQKTAVDEHSFSFYVVLTSTYGQKKVPSKC